MLPCLNKYFLGIDCLGCGMQRSLWLLAKGEFKAAFYMYPAIYPLLGFLLFILSEFFVTIKYSWYLKLTLITAIVVFMVGNYILKMKFIFT
ncbi:DUF2752 domain-containing protein [Aquimarina sp. ERC-38]|uniref:DUF2752 domain-containing protein n=1 Tax=Aquimarina sp. ERC-38 TaxID=2949996 RepID=UPI002246988B|nr:DUF2752 domain-containing protein [Aquimarina sp. ERC-38]UZO79535.1 DUF2752 domain-containing protein [Aquimarina sp. ERC-38]